jgi:hypothetical protein
MLLVQPAHQRLEDNQNKDLQLFLEAIWEYLQIGACGQRYA